jgi:hypothetical protein
MTQVTKPWGRQSHPITIFLSRVVFFYVFLFHHLTFQNFFHLFNWGQFHFLLYFWLLRIIFASIALQV